MKQTDKPAQQSRIEQRRRQEILRAAAEVVAEEGFEGATIRKIAERAGVSPGVLLYYYADKRQLVLETMNDARNRMVEAIGPLSGKPGLELIAAFFQREVSDVDALPMPMSFWLQYWSAALHYADLRPSDSAIDNLFEDSIRSGIETGEVLRGVDPTEAATLLRLVKQGARVETALGSMDEGRIAAAIDLLIRLLSSK